MQRWRGISYVSNLPVTEARVKSQPMLFLKVMSESMVMQQHGYLSTSVTYITTKIHMDIPDLGCCPGPHRCLMAMNKWPCPSQTAALQPEELVPSLTSYSTQFMKQSLYLAWAT